MKTVFFLCYQEKIRLSLFMYIIYDFLHYTRIDKYLRFVVIGYTQAYTVQQMGYKISLFPSVKHDNRR